MFYHAGYDYFVGAPHSLEAKYCKICDTLCDREQAYGSRSSIESMAGHKEHFTRYTCPNSENEWHECAYKLLKYIEECPSDSLIHLMRKDLELILKEK